MDAAIWAAEIARYQAEVSLYAIRVEQLYGAKKLHLGDPMLEGRSEPTSVGPAKCPCCGSRQFNYHHGRRTCAYCRSEQ